MENPNRGVKQVAYNQNDLGVLSLDVNHMDQENLDNFNGMLNDASWKVGNKYTVVKPDASGDIRASLIAADQAVQTDGGYIYIPQSSSKSTLNRKYKISGSGRLRVRNPVVCDAENVVFSRSADVQFGDFRFGINSKFTLAEGVQISFSGTFDGPENKELFNLSKGGVIYFTKTKLTLNQNDSIIPNTMTGRVIYEIDPTTPTPGDLTLYLASAKKTGHIVYVFHVVDNHSHRIIINPEAGTNETIKGLSYQEMFANDTLIIESNGENYV